MAVFVLIFALEEHVVQQPQAQLFPAAFSGGTDQYSVYPSYMSMELMLGS
jgi:hypothetical protein